MKVQEYHNGLMYEVFIRRAFKYKQGSRKIGYWNDNFDKVHKKVESAIDKFLSKKIKKHEEVELLKLKQILKRTYTKESLVKVIKRALEITRPNQ